MQYDHSRGQGRVPDIVQFMQAQQQGTFQHQLGHHHHSHDYYVGHDPQDHQIQVAHSHGHHGGRGPDIVPQYHEDGGISGHVGHAHPMSLVSSYTVQNGANCTHAVNGPVMTPYMQPPVVYEKYEHPDDDDVEDDSSQDMQDEIHLHDHGDDLESQRAAQYIQDRMRESKDSPTSRHVVRYHYQDHHVEHGSREECETESRPFTTQAIGDNNQITLSSGNIQAYQISTPTSLPQGVVMASAGALSGQGGSLSEGAAGKRELRLLKNRDAARECRRKKKEYVKCLENRVAVLENQNKALIEELKSLKELYCQKEAASVQ